MSKMVHGCSSSSGAWRLFFATLLGCILLSSGCGAKLPPDVLDEIGQGDKDATDARGWYTVKVFYGTDRDLEPEPPRESGWTLDKFYPAILLGLVVVCCHLGAVLLSRQLHRFGRWFEFIIVRPVVGAGAVAFLLTFVFLIVGIWAALFPTPGERPDTAYGSGRGTLRYGCCRVSIPKDHKIGRLESPSLFRFQVQQDPREHVVLQRIREYSPADFMFLLQRTFDQFDDKEVLLASTARTLGLMSSPSGQGPILAASALTPARLERQAFVFVHGYHVSFEDAARRTAQLWYDLKFQGPPIFYSWPSKDTTLAYTRDENNAEWTVPHLKEFLAKIAADSGATKVHLIAHSMGNRCLTNALRALQKDPAGIPPVIKEVILTAPDIDRATFLESVVPEFVGRVGRVTLYASTADKALATSKLIHEYPRAGESGDGIAIYPPMESIDVSAVDTSLLGHSYYGDNSSVISDLFYLLKEGRSPNARFGMQEKTRDGKRYYVFLPRR